MRVHTYMCMYPHVVCHTHIFTDECDTLNADAFTYIHAYVYVSTGSVSHSYVHAYVNMGTCIHMRVHTYMYPHVVCHTHMYTHM